MCVRRSNANKPCCKLLHELHQTCHDPWLNEFGLPKQDLHRNLIQLQRILHWHPASPNSKHSILPSINANFERIHSWQRAAEFRLFCPYSPQWRPQYPSKMPQSRYVCNAANVVMYSHVFAKSPSGQVCKHSERFQSKLGSCDDLGNSQRPGTPGLPIMDSYRFLWIPMAFYGSWITGNSKLFCWKSGNLEPEATRRAHQLCPRHIHLGSKTSTQSRTPISKAVVLRLFVAFRCVFSC